MCGNRCTRLQMRQTGGSSERRDGWGGGQKNRQLFLSDRRWDKNLLAKKIGRKQKLGKLSMEQEQQLNAQKILSRINLLMGGKDKRWANRWIW